MNLNATLAGQTSVVAAKDMSCPSASTDTGTSSDCAVPEPKRRKVPHATYLTWKRDLNR